MDQIVLITSAPGQTQTVNLSVDGAALPLKLSNRFNEMANYWVMDIADAQNNPILLSIPLVTGSDPAANILRSFGYLKIGSAYLLNNQSAAPLSDYPNSTNLGTQFAFLWGDTAV